MKKFNKNDIKHVVRLNEKLGMFTKLLKEGANMDWIMDLFITTYILAYDQELDKEVLN